VRTIEALSNRRKAMTCENKWTPEAIRALGPTTDLPTLGAIFECSRWKSYQMARQGEWGRLGIKVLSARLRHVLSVSLAARRSSGSGHLALSVVIRLSSGLACLVVLPAGRFGRNPIRSPSSGAFSGCWLSGDLRRC
jgi:hypothetical protein